MNTNFFENQKHVRSQTKSLIALFIATLTAMIFSFYALATIVFVYWGRIFKKTNSFSLLEPGAIINYKLLTFISVVILSIIILGTFYRLIRLRSGGVGVAKMLGGVLVLPSTQSPNERILLNIVEEMSVASGIPVPQVYVLTLEPTINALAVGTNPSDSVIGVTQGALDLLSREELQGLIGHEFAHIFNGDMKLNLKLIGFISGILVFTTLGRMLIEKHAKRISSDPKWNPLFFLGWALVVLGFVGVFFSRIIKSIVTPQREFQADEASARFTRNPEALAKVLDKIAQTPSQKLLSPYAEETSHLMFETPVRNVGGIFDTHPPLQVRIKRLVPNFKMVRSATKKFVQKKSKRTPENIFRKDERFDILPGRLRNRFGTLGFESLALAEVIIESIPPRLIEKARENSGAQALCLAMMFQPSQKEDALKIIRAELGPKLATEVEEVYKDASKIEKNFRLPLLTICLPALRLMEKDRYEKYQTALERLVELEGDIVFEFCLMRLIEKAFAPPNLRSSSYYSVRDYSEDVLTILKFASHTGSHGSEMSLTNFQSALDRLNHVAHKPLKKVHVESEFAILPDRKKMSVALRNVNRLGPFEKSALLLACATAISVDDRMTTEEMDLVRALSATLDTPLPPNVFI